MTKRTKIIKLTEIASMPIRVNNVTSSLWTESLNEELTIRLIRPNISRTSPKAIMGLLPNKLKLCR